MNREQLLAKFQALSLRERQLLLLGLLVVSYMLCSALFIAPMDAKQQQLAQQLKTTQSNTVAQAGLKKLYEGGLNSDPDKVKKRQLDSLKQRLESLDNTLSELTVGLVPAKQLPQLLQDVLSRHGALELSTAETLPISEMSLRGSPLEKSEPVVGSGGATPSVSADGESAGVFKHSVRVSLAGAFFPVVEYLQTLEALPWRLFWQRLSYQVDDYPTARVEFVVYTLSTEEGLFSAQ